MRRRAWIWATFVVLALQGGRLHAPARAESNTTRTPAAMLASQLNLLATQALASGRPDMDRSDQLTVAQILMDLSLRLNEDDPDVWRLRHRLARRANDQQTMLEALRAYCRLRPDDEPARLQLILSEIDQDRSTQTLDARILAAEEILNRENGLSNAVRSRLASYIATRARQFGDQVRLRRYLKLAINLDAANLEAAQLIVELVKEFDASLGHKGVALIGLVKAAPFDPAVRRELADVLLALNAYKTAAEQYEASALLPRQQAPDGQAFLNWSLSLAAAGQSEQALKMLQNMEAVMIRRQSDRQASQASDQEITEDSPSSDLANQPLDPEAGEATETTGAADEAIDSEPRLPLDLQLLRLVIYQSLNQKEDAAAPFAAIREVLQRQIDDGDDEQAMVDLAWISSWFGYIDEDTKELIGQVVQQRGENDLLVQRIQGFALLHAGQTEAARQVLAPLIARDVLARYGYALTLAANQRASELKQVMRTAPDKVVSVLARRGLETLGIPISASTDGQRLAQMIARWPQAMVMPRVHRNRYVNITASIEPASSLFLDPLFAHVSVENVSDWRLSTDGGPDLVVGQRGTIPTSALIFVKPSAGAQDMSNIPPILTDLNRRLGLNPRERMTTRVSLEQSGLGLLMSSQPVTSFTVRTKLLLDPRRDQMNRPAAGPLGGTVTGTNLAERRAHPPAPLILEQWVTDLQSSDRVQQFLAIARLAYVLPQFAGNEQAGEEANEQATKAIEIFNSIFVKLDALGQAWTVRFLPAGDRLAQLFAPVHELVQRSNDLATRIIYLTIHVQDPKSPMINAALRHTNPQIVEYAQALTGMLEQLTGATEPIGG